MNISQDSPVTENFPDDPQALKLVELPVLYELLDAEGEPVFISGSGLQPAESLSRKGYICRLCGDWFFITPAGLRRIYYEAQMLARTTGRNLQGTPDARHNPADPGGCRQSPDTA